MKNLKHIGIISMFVVTTAMISGCKENKKEKTEDVVEEEMVTNMPNKSDTNFEKTLTAIDKKEYKNAGKYLAEGVEELTKEAKNKGSIFKKNLTTSIKHLTDISNQLEKGEKVDVDALQNIMANAEINVAHDYLVTDDTYVLTAPEKVNDSKLHMALNRNLNTLEAGISKLKGKAKKEGSRLDAEGKKLKKEYESWKKRAEAHHKKTNEHLKKHPTEYNYEEYLGF